MTDLYTQWGFSRIPTPLLPLACRLPKQCPRPLVDQIGVRGAEIVRGVSPIRQVNVRGVLIVADISPPSPDPSHSAASTFSCAVMVKARPKKVTWSPHNVRKLVREKLPRELTEELIQFAQANEPKIWGRDYSPEHLCYIALFHLLCRKSFSRLSSSTSVFLSIRAPSSTTAASSCRSSLAGARRRSSWASRLTGIKLLQAR